MLERVGQGPSRRPERPGPAAVEKAVGAVDLEIAPDLVELLAVVAPNPARLRDVTEFLDQL